MLGLPETGEGDGGTGSPASGNPLLLVLVRGEFSESKLLISLGEFSWEYFILAGSVIDFALIVSLESDCLPIQSGLTGPLDVGRDTVRLSLESEVGLGRLPSKKFDCLFTLFLCGTGVCRFISCVFGLEFI